MRIIFALLVFISTQHAQAWGGRGHDAICHVAVFLVKEPGLKEYLQNKPQMMGHLCNMPDFHWKSLGGAINQVGDPTHYIDPEVLGIPVTEIPLEYKKIIDQFTGKPNKFSNSGTIFSVPQEFGSVWWRADQFMRRLAGLDKDFASAKAPANRQEEQNADLPYNKATYQFVTEMGILGHFVGDNAQPFHTTADYDGYAVGHGGIHAYYEDASVAYFDGDLEARVLKEARTMKNPSFLQPKTTVEKMRALGIISAKEIPTILKLDPILEKSVVKEDKGMKIRTPAKRKDNGLLGYKAYNKMMVTQMARGSVLLAHLWDEAYAKAGRPEFKAYKSYKYPFTVDFIAPDYTETK